jgi:hypothetical protein
MNATKANGFLFLFSSRMHLRHYKFINTSGKNGAYGRFFDTPLGLAELGVFRLNIRLVFLTLRLRTHICLLYQRGL